MKTSWIALIPAYEPSELLLDLLHETRRAGFAAVVVDDGSGTAFTDLFRQAALLAVVLSYPKNRGKGFALKHGLSYIRDHFDGTYIVVTLDADGQHQVSDAVKICRFSQASPHALILGSRNLKNHAPLRSRFGNSVTRLIYRNTTGLRVYDTQTGLRAFSNYLLPWLITIEGERYEYEMNVLLECAREHIPIQEVEIKTIYIDNNSASHFKTVRDSYRVYKEIIKFSASSLIGFLIDYVMFSLLIVVTSRLGVSFRLQISNILARIVSASVNYCINRNFVFKNSGSVAKSVVQYFLLAVAILFGNTLLLSLMVEHWGLNQFGAKICTEVLFFVISWLVQRCVIFRSRNNTCKKFSLRRKLRL